MKVRPQFFVAIAHTDNVACFLDKYAKDKKGFQRACFIDAAGKFLFSMSFDSTIHYETMQSSLDPIAVSNQLENEHIHPRRVFADCGAFQFRHLETPKQVMLSNYNVAWDYYEKTVMHLINGVDLLCSQITL